MSTVQIIAVVAATAFIAWDLVNLAKVARSAALWVGALWVAAMVAVLSAPWPGVSS